MLFIIYINNSNHIIINFRLQNKGTKTESERMRFYAQRYLSQINGLLENAPSSLLLLLKTNDCLRQLDKSVGRPVNTLTGLFINKIIFIINIVWNNI